MGPVRWLLSQFLSPLVNTRTDAWGGSPANRALRPVTWSDKALASAAGMAQVRHQSRRLASGRAPAPGTRPAVALLVEQLQQRKALRRYRAWLDTRRPEAA
ncbi:hypothetical protein [Kitasatospora sp. NPDC056731]|uniref:oxidoreductase n=1 Tax=Kitasatospora sp. NPDC056731 TaxID=3155422 RepID=UPI00342C32BB